MKWVDLSYNNTVTDWSKLKKNVDGLIIRCAYRGYGSGKITVDKKAVEHLSKAHDFMIPFGIYFMSSAITEKEAEEEAVYTVEQAKKYGATLPLFIDSEDVDGTPVQRRSDALSYNERTKVLVAFCKKVESLGYKAGVYASTSWYANKFDYKQILPYVTWVAQYNTKCEAKHRVDAWQYTSKGSIEGIKGNIDLSEVYFLKEREPNPYKAPTRLLKLASPYMRGEDVKWLQYELGMPESEIDGVYGKDTNKYYANYLGLKV